MRCPSIRTLLFPIFLRHRFNKSPTPLLCLSNRIGPPFQSPPFSLSLSTTMAVPAQTLNFCGVLSESKRIINAHSRHFLALSVLFLLPLSFSFIIYPTFQSALCQSTIANTQIFLSTNFPTTPSPTAKSLALPLLYSIFLYLLSLCATATITYSTYHGFYGRPVKLFSAIKSLFYSFLPLISTTLVSQLFELSICVLFLILVGSVTKGIEFLGFDIDYNSSYFAGFMIAMLVGLVLVVLYLQVIWALACVVVVAESKWGLEPLWRSAYLVRGMRSVSLSLLLFFSLFIGASIWANSTLVVSISGWRSWAFIFQTVVGSTVVTIFMLHYAAANTVLYMYCKALHGELAFEIAEEFAREYVSLPFDDEKLPHVVSVVQA